MSDDEDDEICIIPQPTTSKFIPPPRKQRSKEAKKPPAKAPAPVPPSQPPVPRIEADSLFKDEDKCAICGKSLVLLNSARRLLHVNTCLDSQESSTEFAKKVDKYKNTMDCPVCTTPLPPGPFRTSHLRKCGKEHNVPVRGLVSLVDTQQKVVESRRKRQLPHTKAATPVYREKKAPRLQGVPRSVNDEQVQLARALSMSMAEATRMSDEGILTREMETQEDEEARESEAERDAREQKEREEREEEVFTRPLSPQFRRIVDDGRRKRRSYAVVELEPRKCHCDIIDVIQERFLRKFRVRKVNGRTESFKDCQQRREKRTLDKCITEAEMCRKLMRLDNLSYAVRNLALLDIGDITLECSDGVQLKAFGVLLDARTTLIPRDTYAKKNSRTSFSLSFASELVRRWLTFVYSARIEWASTDCAKMKELADMYGPEGLYEECVWMEKRAAGYDPDANKENTEGEGGMDLVLPVEEENEKEKSMEEEQVPKSPEQTPQPAEDGEEGSERVLRSGRKLSSASASNCRRSRTSRRTSEVLTEECEEQTAVPSASKTRSPSPVVEDRPLGEETFVTFGDSIVEETKTETNEKPQKDGEREEEDNQTQRFVVMETVENVVPDNVVTLEESGSSAGSEQSSHAERISTSPILAALDRIPRRSSKRSRTPDTTPKASPQSARKRALAKKMITPDLFDSFEEVQATQARSRIPNSAGLTPLRSPPAKSARLSGRFSPSTPDKNDDRLRSAEKPAGKKTIICVDLSDDEPEAGGASTATTLEWIEEGGGASSSRQEQQNPESTTESVHFPSEEISPDSREPLASISNSESNTEELLFRSPEERTLMGVGASPNRGGTSSGVGGASTFVGGASPTSPSNSNDDDLIAGGSSPPVRGDSPLLRPLEDDDNDTVQWQHGNEEFDETANGLIVYNGEEEEQAPPSDSATTPPRNLAPPSREPSPVPVDSFSMPPPWETIGNNDPPSPLGSSRTTRAEVDSFYDSTPVRSVRRDEEDAVMQKILARNAKDSEKNNGDIPISAVPRRLVDVPPSLSSSTPADKGKKPQFGSNVKVLKWTNITPLPEFERLDDAALKAELAKYGLRPMGRKRAIAKLLEIYEAEHPVVDPEVAAQEAQKAKETSPMKNVTRKRGGAAKKAPAVVRSLEEEEGDDEEGEGADRTLNESLDEEREGAAEESIVMPGELPKNIDDFKREFLRWLRLPENEELHVHLLCLKPVALEEIYIRVSRANSAVSGVSKKALMHILDQLGVTFSLPQDGWKRKAARTQARTKK